MKVYIATDHGGYELKEKLKPYLVKLGYKVKDMGAKVLDPEDDYPDFIIPLAKKVAFRQVRQTHCKQVSSKKGIVLGRSGNGEAIAANKVPGIRAALCLNEIMARKAREHNNANVLSLGADYVTLAEVKKIVKVFLETSFSGEERHRRRIKKIERAETKRQ